MLTGFLRTIVLFSVTAVVLRLMGKRQLAQLQPYEVVITLMISDLATLPMADVEIPLLSGVVSILTLLLVHSLLSGLSYASVRMRRIICGRPSVLVECGFLSNAGEEALLLTADYRQRVAQAIARGIWAWANLPEEKPEALPAVERGGEAEAET